MPCEYHIDTELDLIVMRHIGHITMPDLRGAFSGAVNDPAYHLGMSELSDFSLTTGTDLGFVEIMGIAARFRVGYARYPHPVRVAHYAPGDVAFGMARIYQTIMSDAENLDLGLFRTVPETLAHLGLDRPGMAQRLGLR